jgi:hypothetical protein
MMLDEAPGISGFLLVIVLVDLNRPDVEYGKIVN